MDYAIFSKYAVLISAENTRLERKIFMWVYHYKALKMCKKKNPLFNSLIITSFTKITTITLKTTPFKTSSFYFKICFNVISFDNLFKQCLQHKI